MAKSKYDLEEDIEMMLGEHIEDEWGFPESEFDIGLDIKEDDDAFLKKNWKMLNKSL